MLQRKIYWCTRVYFRYERVSLGVYGRFPWENDVWAEFCMVESVKEDSGDYLKPSGHDIKMEGKMVFSRNWTKSKVVKGLWI